MVEIGSYADQKQLALTGRRRNFGALCLLGVTIFVTITYEVLPVGLLGIIAEGLNTGEQGAGLLVSSYSLVVVLTAIPLSALLARYDARRTLVVVLIIFVASSALMAVAPTLVVALVARVVGGIAHAILYTCVFRLTLALVPVNRRGIAASIVGAGNAVALSLGVPATTAIGVETSWRLPFLIVSTLFVGLAVLTAVIIPAGISESQGRLSTRRAMAEARKWPLLKVGITIMVLLTAQFATYTYVEPFLRSAGVVDQTVSLVLMGYGVASVVGLILVSFVSDRCPTVALRIVIALVGLSLLAVWAAHASVFWASAGVIVWGLTFGALPVLVQVLAIRASDDVPEAAPAVSNTSFNVGIMAGSVAGGQVIHLTEVAFAPLVSSVMFAVMLIVVLMPRWLPADSNFNLKQAHKEGHR